MQSVASRLYSSDELSSLRKLKVTTGNRLYCIKASDFEQTWGRFGLIVVLPSRQAHEATSGTTWPCDAGGATLGRRPSTPPVNGLAQHAGECSADDYVSDDLPHIEVGLFSICC
jgi:hypothetical protein